MARSKKSIDKPGKDTDTSTNHGLETKLWAAADAHRDNDILGRVYEYFHARFASTEDKSESSALALAA